MKKIVIRKVKTDDREQLKKLRLQALQSEPLAFGTSYEEGLQRSDDDRKKRATSSTVHTYGVFVEETMLGMAGRRYSQKIKVKHIAVISGVFLAASLRGQGIAKSLFQIMIDDISTKSFKKIQLMVNETQLPAFHFYKKMGFEEVGRLYGELYYDKKYYDEIVMEKYL